MVLAEGGTGNLEVSKQLPSWETSMGCANLGNVEACAACSSPQAAKALQPSEGVDLPWLNSTYVDNSLLIWRDVL